MQIQYVIPTENRCDVLLWSLARRSAFWRLRPSAGAHGESGFQTSGKSGGDQMSGFARTILMSATMVLLAACGGGPTLPSASSGETGAAPTAPYLIGAGDQ